MTSRARVVVVVLLVGLGCKRPGRTTDGPDAQLASARPSAMAEPPASSASGSAGPSSGSPPTTYRLTYTLSPGTLYIPTNKDWSSAKFKNDEAKYLGEGTIVVTVDGHGRVSGRSEGGPLGAALVDGLVENGTLAATVRRKDPSDEGLTGTLFGTMAGASIDGSMKLAEGKAAVLREAKVSGTKQK